MNSEKSETSRPRVVTAKVGFFKLFFTSCLGTLFALGGLVFIGIAASTQLSKGLVSTVKPNTVLKLSFDQPMPELSNNVPQNPYDPEALFNQSIGLTEMCQMIDFAREDDAIKGIYLDLDNVPIGWATSKTLRDKLEEFKTADKFIIAYAPYYSQKSYYYASVADSVYLYPEGEMSFYGVSAELPFFLGAMEKAGVSAQIFYAGKYKSATEPFRRNDMSEPNRQQIKEYVGGIYNLFLDDVAKSRGTTRDELMRLANEGLVRNAQAAVQYGLVDALKYEDQVIDELRSKLGLEEDDKIEVASVKKYLDVNKDELRSMKNKESKIAVVYAEGSIVNGEGELGNIGGEKYARIIRKLRRDDKVKAIVVRVNSGGGSSIASDMIWRELEMAKEQGITVVASMGDVAASGGYYISSNADRIYAEDRTITGSIGVFGMLFNFRGLLSDHMGVTMDTVKIGEYAMLSGMSPYYELGEKESAIIQQSVNDVYRVFKERVSEGRGMTMEAVEEVAQGRVWLGATAKELGLVDELGGLEQALSFAAENANLGEDDYRVVNYPKAKSFEERLMAAFGGDADEDEKVRMMEAFKHSMAPAELREFLELARTMKELQEAKGAQMRMPYTIKIN